MMMICNRFTFTDGAWGSVVVKALRYQSDGPGIDSRWCHWEFFPWYPPTEPCALRSTQPLKVSTWYFSWRKGGRCVWLTTCHPCSDETSRKSGVLTYPEPLGPPRPVAGHLYLTFTDSFTGFNLTLLQETKYYSRTNQYFCSSVFLLSNSTKIKIYRTIILPIVVYGCETWSIILREERRLRGV